MSSGEDRRVGRGGRINAGDRRTRAVAHADHGTGTAVCRLRPAHWRRGGGGGSGGAADRCAGAAGATRSHHAFRDVPAVEKRLVVAGGLLHEGVEHLHDLPGTGQLLGESRGGSLDPDATLCGVVGSGAHLIGGLLEPIDEVGPAARVDEDLGVRACPLRHAVGVCAELLDRDPPVRERELHELGQLGELERRDLRDGRHVIADERRAAGRLNGERALQVARELILGHRRGRELADGVVERLSCCRRHDAHECCLVVVEKAARALERGQHVPLSHLHCPILLVDGAWMSPRPCAVVNRRGGGVCRNGVE